MIRKTTTATLVMRAMSTKPLGTWGYKGRLPSPNSRQTQTAGSCIAAFDAEFRPQLPSRMRPPPRKARRGFAHRSCFSLSLTAAPRGPGGNRLLDHHRPSAGRRHSHHRLACIAPAESRLCTPSVLARPLVPLLLGPSVPATTFRLLIEAASGPVPCLPAVSSLQTGAVDPPPAVKLPAAVVLGYRRGMAGLAGLVFLPIFPRGRRRD